MDIDAVAQSSAAFVEHDQAREWANALAGLDPCPIRALPCAAMSGPTRETISPFPPEASGGDCGRAHFRSARGRSAQGARRQDS